MAKNPFSSTTKKKKTDSDSVFQKVARNAYYKSVERKRQSSLASTTPTAPVVSAVGSNAPETDVRRDATLKDITINSVKQGYYNSLYGKESYRAMMGKENEKQKYEDILAGEDYQFEGSNAFEDAISGAANLLGQQISQWTDKRSLATAGSLAAMTAAAGNAGPQALLPEEVITVPAAAIAGLQMGSSMSNYEIEAGLAYNEMLEKGISEETAKNVARVVGGANAALEAVQLDELVKSFKILKNNPATKAAADSLSKRLLDLGVDITGNVVKETAQEVAQEGSTIAGTQFASKHDTGEWAYSAGEVIERLGDTAKSAALSFGVMNVPHAAVGTYNAARADKIGSNYNTDIEALVDEGLQSAPDTESYKIASRLKTRLDNGETVSNTEAYDLAAANQRAIYWENYNAQPTVDTSVETDDVAPVESRVQTIQTKLTNAGMDATLAASTATSIDRIMSGDITVTNKDKDVLRVGNKEARAVFEEETGIKLPASNSSTRQTVTNYIKDVAIKQQEHGVTEAKPDETAKKSSPATAQTPVGALSTDAINQLKAGVTSVGTTARSSDSILMGAAVNAVRAKEQATTTFGAKGQSVYQEHLASATSTKSVAAYTRAFQRYYDAGAIGYPLEKMDSAYSEGVAPEALVNAYKAGVEDAQERGKGKVTPEKKSAQKAAKNPSIGKGRFYDSRTDKSVGGDRTRKEVITALKQMARVFNVDIELRDTIARNGKSYANGYYENGKIILAADGDNPLMTVVKHEITHHLQKTSPQKYKELRDYVMKAYYNNSPEAMNDDIKHRISLAALNGVKLTRVGAMDEILADATESFLTDRDSADALVRENRSLAETILNALRDVLRKIEAAMKGEKFNGYSDFMNAEQLKAAEKMWVDALADAANSEIGINYAEVTESVEPIWSLKSMKFDLLDGKMQSDLVEHGIMTLEESLHLMSEISKLIDKMSPFAHIVDMNEEYDRDNRPFEAFKPNNDALYKVSLDFSTLCKKRLMTQFVMESLQTKLKRALSAQEQMAIRSKLEEYGKVNKQIQVACALCYVEAARLKAPAQINRFLNDKTTILTNYFGRKNADHKQTVDEMANKMKVELGYSEDTKLKDMKGSDKKKVNEAKRKMMEAYTPTAEEQKIIDKANAMDNAEFLSQAGLTRLNLTEPVIYDAFVGHVRDATHSKALESGIPYYYGDSKSVSDALIDAMNAENGLRHQSWSDFEIVHLLDNIAAVIDLSVRKAKMQAYTKVPAFVHVNGNTGMMINLSLIPAGKNGIKDGKLDFSPTEGMDFAVAVELRDQYHKTAGTIAIGIDDKQIEMLLNDPTIDYVIPYHSSGMNAQLRKMAGISGWSDYQLYQSEKTIDGAKRGNCPAELWHKHPDFSEWFDISKLDMSKSGVEIMREAAGRYLVLCEERGLHPKFSNTKNHTDFSKHENYWKLLIDRKMVDGDGNIIIQQAVRPDFDFEKISEIVGEEIANYDPTLLDSINEMIMEDWESGAIKQREAELLTDEKAKKKAAKVANGLIAQAVIPEGAKASYMDGKYDYETLVAKPNMKLTEVDDTVQYDVSRKTRKDIVKEAQKKAASVGTTNDSGGVSVYVDDIGVDVVLSADGLYHGLDRRLQLLAPVTVNAGEILKNAIRINEMTPKKETASASYVLLGVARGKTNDLYIVEFVVNRFDNTVASVDVLYSVNTKKESAALNAPELTAEPLSVTDSTISIAQLLDLARENFPDILPESVLRHYGFDRRPEGVLGESALFSFKDFQDEVAKLPEEDRAVARDAGTRARLARSIATLTGSRLDKIYDEYSYSSKKDTKAYLAYIDPYDFLALTTTSTQTFLEQNPERLNEGVSEQWGTQNNIQNPDLLYLRIDEDGNVIGHEGRHRMAALYREGIERVAVAVVVGETKNAKPVDIIRLNGQKNSGITSYYNAWLHDLLPVSKEYEAVNRYAFGDAINDNHFAEPSIRYQLKTPPEMLEASKQIAEAEHRAKAVTDAEIMSQAVKSIAHTDDERRIVSDYQRAMKTLADYEQKLAVYEATEAQHGKSRSIYTDASGKVKKAGVRYSAAEKAEITRKIEWWKSRLNELEQKAEFQRVLKREKAKMLKRHADEINELRAKYNERLGKLREQRDAKVDAQKQKMRDYKQHQRDSKEYKTLKAKLESDVKWLSERLDRPSEAKHIPDKFRRVVAAFLASLDFTTKRMDKNFEKSGEPSKKAINMWTLIDEYREIAKDDSSPLVLTPIEEEFHEAIKETFSEGKRVEDLTYGELQMVYDIIRYIKKGVATANKLHNEEIAEGVAELGDTLIVEQRSKKSRKEHTGIVGGVDKLLSYDNVAPEDKFHEFGGVMERLYGEIRKGFNKHIENVRTAIDYTQKLVEGHEDNVKMWSGKNAKAAKFQISDGTTIELTPAQVMSLYCLMKRDQAVGHVLGSGIVPSNVVVNEAKKLGKLKVDVAKRITSERASRCTIEDIQNIVNSLTEDQKRIADGIVKLFTTKCADWGNETSLKLYEIKKFTEPNYFPIKSSDAYLNARFDESGDVLIKNLGMTKNTIVNANNPIVVEDIFDVLADHVNKMSMYNALVVPLTDFTRVFNYKRRDKDGNITDSVRKALEASDGNLGIRYINQFIRDVNKQASSLEAESFINQSISRYKKAKIAMSARVLAQQPTAITRAAAMVDPKYLIEGLKQKGNYEEMFTYSQIAYWKSLGFYQTDMSRSMKDILLGNESKLDKVTMGMYGKADDFAWVHLWNAIKLEQADAHPEMDTTSSEFMELVAERFDAVVNRTQVVDSVFHRSQMMRAQGAATKIATAFMAESTKGYNLLRTDLLDSIKEKDYSKIKRSVVTFVANAVLVSAAAAIVDAIRDDDDEDDEGNKRGLGTKYLEAAAGNIADNINPLNVIPYGKDIASLLKGYDVNRMEMASVAEFIKTAKKWTQGKYTLPFLVKETAEDISEMFGVPLKNAIRDVTSLVRTAGDIVGGHYYADYMVDKAKYVITNPDNRSVFYKHYTDALLAGDEKAANAILTDMVVNGIPYDNIINRGYKAQKEVVFSEARKLIADGKTEEARKLVRELAKDYDKSFNTLWKAVKSGDSADEPEETYTFTDLKRAVRKGEDTEEIEDYLVDYGGYSEEAIEEAIKMLLGDK